MLIQVSILRSEFDAAEEVIPALHLLSPPNTSANLLSFNSQALAQLTAHTLNTGPPLWPEYAARITLHHAHLAHALGRTERARTCYRVAGALAAGEVGVTVGTEGAKEEGLGADMNASAKRKAKGKGKATPKGKGGKDKNKNIDGECVDRWVEIAAKAGGVALDIGIWRGGGGDDSGTGQGTTGMEWLEGTKNREWVEDLKRRAKESVRACKGMGGTLEAVGGVIEACLVEEIIGAKCVVFLRSLSFPRHSFGSLLDSLILILISDLDNALKPRSTSRRATLTITCVR
jgi:hypothetical protein